LALIRGIGLSNDVGGSLLAPDGGGQLRAMRQAYAEAGWEPASVGLVECHATGTPVGDAVELGSLRELWKNAPREARAAIGSVKSNVGHLLTGAGAAGLAKTLLAIKEKTLPPSAHFERSSAGLEESPFRVLSAPQAWESGTPRRAAVSAFGFGGINAHVLLEEYAPRKARTRAATKPASPKIAIVGMEARFGALGSLREFQEAVLAGKAPPANLGDAPARRWLGAAGRPGRYLDEVSVPAGTFRIPPKEIEEMLPQQLLMLAAARAALVDANALEREHERTGVFVGMELDPNTANFHFRWAQPESLREAAGPALSANRTMGALGGIIASRIAREFKIGGPSFTLAAEEASGLRAVQAGARALERGELDCAVVGAVDLCGDIRHLAAESSSGRGGVGGEGAAAFVLKRLDDAVRDGDRVYAVLDFSGKPAVPLAPVDSVVGRTGAAAGAAALAQAALALYQQILPAAPGAPTGPRFWLRNRKEGPRRAAVQASGGAGLPVRLVLEELEGQVSPRAAVERRQPLGSRSEALFVAAADDVPAMLASMRRLKALARGAADVEALARRWFAAEGREGRLAVSLVARDAAELVRLIELSAKRLGEAPDQPFNGHGMDRAFYSPKPLRGKLAFVFPGSGNHYLGMGAGLGVQWPEILRAQDARCLLLKDQLVPERFAPLRDSWPVGWEEESLAALDADHPALILGQVAYGAAQAELAKSFGLEPAGAIGYSLGETASLFALGAWTSRDEMLRRVRRSPLFSRDLAGPCAAAAKAWKLPAKKRVDWSLGVVDRSAAEVRAALKGLPRAYLLIINSPRECVVGGDRPQVEALRKRLACAFLPVSGVTTVHCDVAKRVEKAYLALHLLPTKTPEGLTFYSGAWGKGYAPTRTTTARSITDQALGTVDFPAAVEKAYADGFRFFVELGPRGATARMIGQILAGKPHFARSADLKGQDEVSSWLRLLAALAAERVPMDLSFLYGGDSPAVGHRAERPAVPRIAVSLGLPAPRPAPPPFVSKETFVPAEIALSAHASAHQRFLKLTQFSIEAQSRLLELRAALASKGVSEAREGRWAPSVTGPAANYEEKRDERAVFMSREQCLEFAKGKIEAVLGRAFAEADAHPTRVRLPDEPLMLVDRILKVEGEPRSMGSGRVVTEHDVKTGAWYLDGGRIPTCVAVEAGQADLFLSGYLGIDFVTKGLARYRLLDAVVTFHGELPPPGKVIHYDIRIERFARQGGAHLFFFNFDGTVDGKPLLTMRDGCAGFFTEAELAAGKGIVFTELDRRARPGKRPADWEPLVPMERQALDDARVEALRRGDLAAAFGPAFAGLPIEDPLRIPGGKLRLLDRVLELDPAGGRHGLGLIRAEADIHPDDWFLTCHFTDDMVMPGTLMYECCMHTLRVLLMRMGWVGEGSLRWEPIPGVKSRLKCRGQVLPSTKKAVYEIWIKELGYGPEPFAIADALMYSDGKPIVLISDMSIKLVGSSRESLRALWSKKSATPVAREAAGGFIRRRAIFDDEKILAFAVGKPSEAFGDKYRIFDERRVIARLPGPPYKFLNRIVSIENARPFTLAQGAVIEAEYDVPPDAWYFRANRQGTMPFAVLLEAALQPCGWLAAYLGSALLSDQDLSFRNLGGKAVLHREVLPDAGTLITRVKLTRTSLSGGMIIQHYDLAVRSARDGAPIYDGTTYFGFFSKAALSDQKGIMGAGLYAPGAEEAARGKRLDFPFMPPLSPEDSAASPASAPALPARALRMFDAVPLFVPDGGPNGLGFIRGEKRVDPAEWFFKAHFFQDPVCPGSLGLESFLQLLRVVSLERWGAPAGREFGAFPLGLAHEWVYRGQVVPSNKKVTVEACVSALDEDAGRIVADGFLSVDGLTIYQMKAFGAGWRRA
ncbi:MAG TPA: beta-ketoacyl synthase N-terminal-like domain-containing protein, partial [Elusimicrobiota bacterium]|nr:beta-ketoacyl synthase N-terminal-like domain-containing protein [Elusimicrobiota bacterium]